jgi:hypothetical protein
MALQSAGSLVDPDDWAGIDFPRARYTSQFSTMLQRISFHGRYSRRFPFDPKLQRGQYIFTNGGKIVGRVTRVTDNLDPNDWFAEATEWTVHYEKPWNQSEVRTEHGGAKIEWMEDKLFPRVGTVLDTGPNSMFRDGDIVMIVAGKS